MDVPQMLVLRIPGCDPKKCSALKLARYGKIRLVQRPRQIRGKPLIMNPFAMKALSPADLPLAKKSGILVLDCSWSEAVELFQKRIRGEHRCLPYLIAVNPINYGKVGKLSSVEALAGALFILGYRDTAEEILNLFKWGPHFLELNEEPLLAYQTAQNSREIIARQREFMGQSEAID